LWVELTTAKYIERNGKMIRRPPGVRLNIGRTDAIRWIAAGDAIPVEMTVSIAKITGDAGFVVTGDLKRAMDMIRIVDRETPIITGSPRCEYGRTCIWDTGANMRPDLFGVGFNLLARWQMAVPLWSYTELACHIGTDDDRARTQTIIRELRVPLYDTRLIFVRRCDDMLALLDLWLSECNTGGDARLAFLRAMYRIKPTICALPSQWIGRGE
jgi:hypothetical protein